MAVTEQTVSNSNTPTPPLAARAAALLRASAKKTFDPFTAIDWTVPYDDSRYYLPPASLPLYGTALWDTLDEHQRRAYSRHEAAALCGTGIWLENILMRMVIDHLYELAPTDPTLRYLLVEIGDECRHSSMFGEFISRAKTPAYRPTAKTRALGRLARLFRGPSAFVAILAAEELLDAVNRQTMRDESLHPVAREVSRIHVVEEARHVSFAKAYLEQELPKINGVRLAIARLIAPFTVKVIADAMVHPGPFDALSIVGGEAAARNNPLHSARIQRDLEQLVGFLERIGLITETTRPLWESRGLVAKKGERRKPARQPRTANTSAALH